MKLVDLCEFYSERGGGVRSYLTQLSDAAASLGHEVCIVAPGPKDEVTQAGSAKLIRYRAPHMPYDATYHIPWRLDVMRRVVREEAPDVVQASSPFAPAWVAARCPAPLRTYVYHSDPIGCYVRPTIQRWAPASLVPKLVRAASAPMRALCSKMDATVVAGPWLADELAAWGCPKVYQVPFGIRHEHFGPHLRSEALRRKLLGEFADTEGAVLFLITGRLAADKRQDRLVEAVVRLSSSRPVALVVVGDGPERERLKKLAFGLKAVTFIPFTKDRGEYATILASADVLLHGSVCETYGFVLAEALTSGTPVVVANLGAAAALAPPGGSERYPAFGDSRDVADAATRLLARNLAECRQQAQLAGLAQPHMDRHFEKLFELYASLLADKRRTA